VTLGATWSFGLNALSFLAVIAAAFAIAAPATRSRPAESVFQSLRLGLRYLRLRPDLIIIITLAALTGLLGAPAITMLPALVKEAFNGNETMFSMLLSCFGGGA